MYCKSLKNKKIVLFKKEFIGYYKKIKTIRLFSIIFIYLIKLYNFRFIKQKQIINFVFNFLKKDYNIYRLSRLYSKIFIDYIFKKYSLNLIYSNSYLPVLNIIKKDILGENNDNKKNILQFCFFKKRFEKIICILIPKKFFFFYKSKKFFKVNPSQFISKIIFFCSNALIKHTNIQKNFWIKNFEVYRLKQFTIDYYNIVTIIKEIINFIFYLDVFLQNIFRFLVARNKSLIYSIRKKENFKNSKNGILLYWGFFKIAIFNQLNFLLISHSNSLILWIRKITSIDIRQNISKIKYIFNSLTRSNISAKKNSVIKIFLLTLELIKGNPTVNILIFKYFLGANKDFFSDLTQKFFNRMPFILEKHSSKSINKIKYDIRLFVLPFELFYNDLFRKFLIVKIFYSNVNFQKLYLSNWIYMELNSFNYKMIKILLKMKYIKNLKLITVSKILLRNFVSLYSWIDAFDFLKTIHSLNLSN